MFLKAKERLGTNFIPPWVKAEHQARYEFASVFVPNKIVVDCACGEGIGSVLFAKAGAKEVKAFDISQETIENNQKNNTQNNLFFAVSSAEKLPLSSDFADVFISLETIEHLKNDQEFLQEVKRVLKPDGVFICSTPNRLVTNPGKKITDKPWNKFHIREYDSAEFKQLLEGFFKEVDIYGQNAKIKTIVKFKTDLAKFLPKNLLVFVNQLLKLPLFLLNNKFRQPVVKSQENREFEYLLAVCKLPIA